MEAARADMPERPDRVVLGGGPGKVMGRSEVGRPASRHRAGSVGERTVLTSDRVAAQEQVARMQNQQQADSKP